MPKPGTFFLAMQDAFGMSYADIVHMAASQRLDFIKILAEDGYPLAGTEAKAKQIKEFDASLRKKSWSAFNY